MADYRKIVSLIKGKGGLTSAPFLEVVETGCDFGSSYNAFLKKNIKNTVSNGIDWTFFKDNANELGYDATCENFKNMPVTIFNVIFKLKRWDNIKGDKIKNQGIANIIALYYSGSSNFFGLAIIFQILRKFGYVRPYISSPDIGKNLENSFILIDEDIDFINKLDSEGKSPLLFDELTKNIPKGKIYWFSKRYVLRTSEKVGLGIGVLLIGYLGYKLIKR
jgi:hypothetical protein